MNNINQPVTQPTIPPLTNENWHAVSARYATALRIYLIGFTLVLLALPLLHTVLEPGAMLGWLALPILLISIVLGLVWIPRKVRYTRYCRRPLDMHMQTGCWWHRTTSVSVNRIQHLEITQGPVERMLGLSKLVLYTAGGSQSDLSLPGLETHVAHQLKAQLLHQITQEQSTQDQPIQEEQSRKESGNANGE